MLTLLFVSLWVGICWGVGGSLKYTICGAVSFTFSLSFTSTGHCFVCVPVCSSSVGLWGVEMWVVVWSVGMWVVVWSVGMWGVGMWVVVWSVGM